jgi:hypothetical protein
MIEWLPTPSDEIMNWACPLLSVPLPRVAVPSLKVTVPVGVPAVGLTGDTIAVKVTDWPYTEGLGEEIKLVVVLSG